MSVRRSSGPGGMTRSPRTLPALTMATSAPTCGADDVGDEVAEVGLARSDVHLVAVERDARVRAEHDRPAPCRADPRSRLTTAAVFGSSGSALVIGQQLVEALDGAVGAPVDVDARHGLSRPSRPC